LLIPAIILGGIFLGWFTATEAAAVAVLLALLMGVVGYRTVRFAAIREAFTESARQTAVVMLLVAGSAILGWYLANQQAPERLTAWVLSLADAPWAVALILNGVLLLAGTILHSAAAIVLLVPILLPLAESAGIGTVHFGMMVTVSLAVGQQTPPVASVLITTCSIAKTEISEVMKVNVFFIAALLVVLGIVTFWPEASLFLPDLILGEAGG
ncbi:MAG: TRAP transporter large permease subunit, partial [Gammaproteobacteria bacterium]|nr:TRAP transporter large permease subunit [Gammaproteobacteria bacterium]